MARFSPNRKWKETETKHNSIGKILLGKFYFHFPHIAYNDYRDMPFNQIFENVKFAIDFFN